jgi:hypothetical protein
VCVECLIGKQKKPILFKVTEPSSIPYRTPPGHGESAIACALILVRRGEYRAQTGIWQDAKFCFCKNNKRIIIIRATAPVALRTPIGEKGKEKEGGELEKVEGNDMGNRTVYILFVFIYLLLL